jgi:hypothetical protein
LPIPGGSRRLAFHAALYLTAIFWVLSLLQGVVFLAVHQAVFSLYLGCSFAPNHKGMPLIDEGSEMSFRPTPDRHRSQRYGRLADHLLFRRGLSWGPAPAQNEKAEANRRRAYESMASFDPESVCRGG